MKIIIAGGTGFIGAAIIARLLSEGHEVVVLTRRATGYLSFADKKVQTVFWDARTPGPWGPVLEGTDAVINLSGESIAGGAWTKRRKQTLYESRLSATQTIVRAIGACKTKPRVFINASAIGYYGDGQDRLRTEDSEKGEGFLADLCAAWEKAAIKAEDYGVRTVLLRTGLVLDRGAFLDKMSMPFRFFIGGPLGSGRQWMSWIWREDLAGAVIFLIDHSNLRGPVNCVSPEPVTMTGFCRALGKALRRPSWFPMPSFLIRAVLGQISELVLKSQRVTPKKLLEAGFRYKMTTITEILTAIFVSNNKPEHL